MTQSVSPKRVTPPIVPRKFTEIVRLRRPIVFYDVETTGIDPEKDRLVAIAVRKHFPDADSQIGVTLINPGIPIPESATEIHGITNEMVADAKPFSAIAQQFYRFMSGCDFAGYNIRFDSGMLKAEFKRSGIIWDDAEALVLDPLNLWYRLEPRDLENAVERWAPWFKLHAHAPDSDIQGTEEVFLSQVEGLENRELDEIYKFMLPDDFVDRDRKFVLKNGDVYFNFGKHRGQRAVDNLDYLEWMLGQSFPADTLQVCRRLIRGEKWNA